MAAFRDERARDAGVRVARPQPARSLRCCSGFRGENLWFQSAHASALTPQLVDAYLAGCDGRPLGNWQPRCAYTASSDPLSLGNAIPAMAGAGKP